MLCWQFGRMWVRMMWGSLEKIFLDECDRSVELEIGFSEKARCREYCMMRGGVRHGPRAAVQPSRHRG